MAFDYWQHFESGSIYHIYNHACGDLSLFKEGSDYNRFLIKYQQYLSCCFKLYAYCLMPNHFHFLVEIKQPSTISTGIKESESRACEDFILARSTAHDLIIDQMRRWFSSHALYYNRKYKYKGQLFLKRPKRVSLSADDRLAYLVKYIHHNPIHHTFTKDYSTWPYSSYHDYLSPSSLVNPSTVLSYFGGIDCFLQEHADFKLDQKKMINLD